MPWLGEECPQQREDLDPSSSLKLATEPHIPYGTVLFDAARRSTICSLYTAVYTDVTPY
jgi:hypothetical protein